jgi:outer membrane protein
MKKTAIALAMLAVAPLSAHADLLFTLGAKASVWNADASGQLDKGVSVEDDLNIDSENGQQLTVYFEHPIPLLPNIKIKQTNLEMTGNSNVNITFLDKNFTGDVDSTLDLTHTDLTLYWGLPLPIPFFDFNFGLTARQFDGLAEVRSSSDSASQDLNFVIPMAYGEIKVTTPFGLYANADINYIGTSGNKLSDVSYELGYDLPIPVVDLGLEAGYRAINLKTNEDLADIATDVKISGLYYGASLSVGF